MKRVAIFGGTFDPPHEGHLGVARRVAESGIVDEVWMMVSPENPFKAGKRLSSEEDRIRMTQLAVESLPAEIRRKVRVSDFEARLPLPTYTVTTLRALKEAYPDCSFRLVVGGDNLTAFGRWRNPYEIINDYGLIVYPRPGDECNDKSGLPPGCVIIEDVPLFPCSSTEVRRLIANGDWDAVEGIVPKKVADYIKEREIYG